MRIFVLYQNFIKRIYERSKVLAHFPVLFLDGFNKVFPLEKLFPFSPDELQLILCGEQVPQWTREDVLNYTEPKLGFTRER